jgi:hypothetical protein
LNGKAQEGNRTKATRILAPEGKGSKYFTIQYRYFFSPRMRSFIKGLYLAIKGAHLSICRTHSSIKRVNPFIGRRVPFIKGLNSFIRRFNSLTRRRNPVMRRRNPVSRRCVPLEKNGFSYDLAEYPFWDSSKQSHYFNIDRNYEIKCIPKCAKAETPRGQNVSI